MYSSRLRSSLPYYAAFPLTTLTIKLEDLPVAFISALVLEIVTGLYYLCCIFGHILVPRPVVYLLVSVCVHNRSYQKRRSTRH